MTFTPEQAAEFARAHGAQDSGWVDWALVTPLSVTPDQLAAMLDAATAERDAEIARLESDRDMWIRRADKTWHEKQDAAQPKPQSEPVAIWNDEDITWTEHGLNLDLRSEFPLYAAPPNHTALLREALAALNCLVYFKGARCFAGMVGDSDVTDEVGGTIDRITKALEQS